MVGIALRPFLDLLPYRIDQALADYLVGSRLRAWRVRRRRADVGDIKREALRLASEGRRRLYIDLAVISRDDAGTGIQRVVRALALSLLEQASSQWDVQFVTAFRHSAYHVISWPESVRKGDNHPRRQNIVARPGDVFLGLDFSLDAVRRHRRQLARFRRDGGTLWFLVCDLLPVQRPDWFAPNNVIRYKAWLESIAGFAEGFLCISAQTEMELISVLKKRFALLSGDPPDGYLTRVVPMGHDIMESVPSAGRGGDHQINDTPARFDMATPFTLMVGTLEPRKGHADIIAAFSRMWRRGASDRLVLVGRMGWRVEKLRAEIVGNAEFGGRLLWFDDVGDAELEAIYRSCQGMIIASHAEGFGLPLIEALGHRKPVLARDIPIFRQHEDLGVRYFPADAEPREVANCIRSWIEDAQRGQIIVTPPVTGWQESARVILSALDPPPALPAPC